MVDEQVDLIHLVQMGKSLGGSMVCTENSFHMAAAMLVDLALLKHNQVPSCEL